MFITTTGNRGRLGNQIIRNLAVSLIAQKHNLKVQYYNKDTIQRLGIQLFSGTNSYNSIIDLTDDNFFFIYNDSQLNSNLESFGHFFQTKQIIQFLYDYLHTPSVQNNIINNNPYKDRYNNNNDLFIHIRLTDVQHLNPGIDYYVKAIHNITFNNIYISTDDPNHIIITQLIQSYPYAQLIALDEIHTFQFASTCKHIILSHGSFSAIIGYLSFFSNIYYPQFDPTKIWHGDMFSIQHWIQVTF
jgi:hypothetical protein